MSELKRLLDQDATETERLLLVAGVRDEPSEQSTRRAAAVLGLGAAATLGASALQAAQVGKTWAPLWKWAAVALVASSAVLLARRFLPSGEPSLPDSTPAVAVASRAIASAPPISEPGAPHEDLQPQAAIVAPSAPPPRMVAPARSMTAPKSSGGSLQDEIHALDEIRRAVGAGNYDRALARLTDYQKDYPRGTLGQEATLLRIEALARSGNRPAAEALARQFLADQPNSPHAKRIESLLHQAGTPTRSR